MIPYLLSIGNSTILVSFKIIWDNLPKEPDKMKNKEPSKCTIRFSLVFL